MGREIIYDRRFIKVGDKYIPLFQHGSSNCTQFVNGREVYEKNWSVLNYKQPYKILFTEKEIKELAKTYTDSEFYNKSRNKPFNEGQFLRYFINGVKHAQPIEYFKEHGNSLFITEYGTSLESGKYLNSTEELLDIVEQVDIKNMFGNAHRLTLKFNNRDLFLPKKRRTLREKKLHPHYFILSFEKGYFVKKIRYAYKYIHFKYDHRVKKFKTEAEAKKYIEKYNLDEFAVERIEEEAYF